MLKHLLLLLACVAACSTSAQTARFAGEWACNGIPEVINGSIDSLAKENILFNGESLYERKVFFYDNATSRNDTFIEVGKYSYNEEKKLITFIARQANAKHQLASESYTFTSNFVWINDSTFSLFAKTFYKKSRNFAFGYYHKLTNNQFYLQNIKDSTRRIYIPDPVVIATEQPAKDSVFEYKSNYISCTLDSLQGNSLFADVYDEDVSIQYRNSSRTSIQNYYSDPVRRKIDINTINYLRMRTHFRRVMSKAAGFVFTISLIDAVLAPIISYNYSAHKMNNDRLSTLFGIGLGGIGLSIPLAIMGSKKRLVISKDYKTRASNYWQIVQSK